MSSPIAKPSLEELTRLRELNLALDGLARDAASKMRELAEVLRQLAQEKSPAPTAMSIALRSLDAVRLHNDLARLTR